ncbi:MAG: hypothetical protein ACYDHF_02275 [Candidatus Cryosericum sp.]
MKQFVSYDQYECCCLHVNRPHDQRECVFVGRDGFVAILKHARRSKDNNSAGLSSVVAPVYEKEITVGNFMSLLALFVTRPAEAMRRIREHPAVLTALIALLLTGIVDAMSFKLIDIAGLLKSLGLAPQLLDAVAQAQKAPGTFWAFVTEPFFLMMLTVLIMDGMAQLVWKRTAAPFLYVSLSLSGLVGSILRVTGILLAGLAGGALLEAMSYVAILYVFVMGVLTVRFFYEKTTIKALLLYLVPTVLAVAAFLILTLTVGGAA